jgi:hypothetical protein
MTVGTSGSSIADIARLKRHTVGVVGGDINQKIVIVLTKALIWSSRISLQRTRGALLNIRHPSALPLDLSLGPNSNEKLVIR